MTAEVTTTTELSLPLLLVDDHEILTTGMAAYLCSHGFIVETVNPSTIDDVLSHPIVVDGGLVVSDLQMPAIPDPYELIATLTARQVRVLVLTGETDPATTARALRAGALALVQKSEPLEVLADLIRTAAHGGPLRIADREQRLGELRALEKRERDAMSSFTQLSSREQEILVGLMNGLNPTAIAESGFVSIATVRAQIRSILAKLGANSQLEAVAMANRVGFKGRQVA